MKTTKTTMIALLMLTALGCEDPSPGHYEWQPTPEREDLRACNMARAGEGIRMGNHRFHDCMYSLGYRYVFVSEAGR